MAGLPRSEMSFRRQGSSGLVWDDSFVSGELNKVNKNESQEKEEQQQNRGENSNELNTINTQGYRTGKFTPDFDPPSPKVTACGCCSPFGNKKREKGQRSKDGKRRSK